MSVLTTKKYTIDADAYVYFHLRRKIRDTILVLGINLDWLILPCWKSNLRDFAESQSVEITNSNIVYVQNKYKSCWRCDECDQPKVTKNIPREKVVDIVVMEPAGDCCPPNMLYSVSVQTAANSGVPGSELFIEGLSKEDAYEFRDIVFRKKFIKPSQMTRN